MLEVILTQRADLDLEEMADSQPLLPGHMYLYPPDQEIGYGEAPLARIPEPANIGTLIFQAHSTMMHCGSSAK